MQPAGIAHVDQEADHHRLVAFAGKELDPLFLALVHNLKILLVQVRHETALFIGHRYGHDDFIDLHFDRRRFLRRRGSRWLRSRSLGLGKKRNSDKAAQKYPGEHVVEPCFDYRVTGWLVTGCWW